MPRTIDHIVETHRAAAELRAAGKPVWSKRIPLKQYIGDDDSDNGAREAGRRIATALRLSGWAKTNGAIAEIIENMDDVIDLEDFNEQMDAIYDEAGYDRVWIA